MAHRRAEGEDVEGLVIINTVLLCITLLLLVGAINKYQDASRKLTETKSLALRVLMNKKRS